MTSIGGLLGQVTGSSAQGQSSQQFVIPETSSSDDADESDGESGGHAARRPRFRFTIEQSPLTFSSSEDYVASVFKWSSKPYLGQRPFWPVGKKGEVVSMGPYTIPEVQKLVQDAADKAGFSVYCHKGHRLHEKRVALKFGCDHGRKRYGKNKTDNKMPAAFQQEVETVVASTVGKRRALSKHRGYKQTPTAHRRHKCVECSFSLLLSGVQGDGDRVDATMPMMWSMSQHGLAKFNFHHSQHTFRGCRTIISDEVRQFLLANGDSTPIPALVKTIRRSFHVSLDRSQVRYFLKTKEMRPPPADGGGGRGESGSGNALQTIRFLLKSKNSVVVLALINCDTGEWKTGNCTLEKDGNVKIETVPCSDVHDKSFRPEPIRIPDEKRVVYDTDARTRYFVHTMAWNYIDDAQLFAAYSWTVSMDVQHGVNNSTDGFNAIGTCGNYHNIVVMRAYIGSQKAETFRWLLRVAFKRLVKNFANIRAFFVDGWQATIAELQILCLPGSMFPHAQIILCMWHLLTDAYDKKFGYAMQSTWFKKFKSMLYRLRNCEIEEEFKDCKEYVLRSAASDGHAQDGDSDFPNVEMVKFIMPRVERPERWVLKYSLATLTRGALTTQRNESDHGDSRTHGINAKCSWLLTVKKHETAHHERRIALLKWSDKQLGRALCRGPANAEVSTISHALLVKLDSFMLPWALDALEIQLLLAQKDELQCVFAEHRNEKLIFKVYYDNDDSDNEDVANDPVVSSMVEESSSDESDDERAPKKSRSAASMSSADVATDDDMISGATYDFTDDLKPKFEEVMANALPVSTNFYWKKIRTLHVIPDARDACYAYVVCLCGYPCRIGLPCRHVFRLLFKILDKKEDFSWSNFELLFEDLVKLDIVSKVKYHAALRDQTGDVLAGFAKLHNTKQFHPRIPFRYVTQFLSHSRPEGYDRLPQGGLPQRSDMDGHGETSGGHVRAAQQPHRRESERDSVPTESRVFHEMHEIWDRTRRMTGRNQSDGRRLVGTTLATLKDQIYAMQPDIAPKKLTRHFSVSDLYKGRR